MLFQRYHIAYLIPVAYVETSMVMSPCVTTLVDAVSFKLSWTNVGGHLKAISLADYCSDVQSTSA